MVMIIIRKRLFVLLSKDIIEIVADLFERSEI